MNFKQLKYFVTVAEEQQVTAAAKKLNIAQPPLSYQLKQLEKELDVQLIKRTAHGIQLTSAGVMFEKYAKQIIDLAEITQYKVKNIQNGTFGTLRLGMTPTSTATIPNEKNELLTKYYPDVKFKIKEGSTYELLDLLRKNLIDVAVVRTPFNEEGLGIRFFKAEPMVAVIPQKFQTKCLCEKCSIDIEELGNLPLIVYNRFKITIKDSFENRGLQSFIAVECDDSRTAIQYAESNFGVALVPQNCAKCYANNNVKLLPVAYENWNTRLAIVWQNKQEISGVLQKFIKSYENITVESK